MVSRSRRSAGKYRVFLSHANEDRWVAEVIRQKLHELGVEVWLDVFDLPGGASIKERLRHEMHHSDECLVLFSPASRHSDWVRHEVGLAHALGKWTTVLLLHATPQELPEPWRDLKYLSINDFPAYLGQVSARADRPDESTGGWTMHQVAVLFEAVRRRG
jgi:hypothetical protein